MVKTMAAMGCSQGDIAVVLGMTAKTLRQHFREELDRAAIEANAQVMASLFQMATSGKNAAAAIFWAKTRCGMREKPVERESTRVPPSLLVTLE